jgi:hypothetical protein
MIIKPHRIAPSIEKGDAESMLVKNSEFVAGSTSTYILEGDIVTVEGIDGGYATCRKAKDGVTDETGLWVALQEIRGGAGRIGLWTVEKNVDTSTAAADGDPIYLSDATAGAWVVAAPAGSPVIVGKVLAKHATEGAVLIQPRV